MESTEVKAGVSRGGGKECPWLIGYSVTSFKRFCGPDKFVNFCSCIHGRGFLHARESMVQGGVLRVGLLCLSCFQASHQGSSHLLCLILWKSCSVTLMACSTTHASVELRQRSNRCGSVVVISSSQTQLDFGYKKMRLRKQRFTATA
jgi:hypothetical protein